MTATTEKLARDATNWQLLETLLADKGWPRDMLTPYDIADRFPQRWQVPSGNRYDLPLPLPEDDAEADDAA